jgi:superfamily II DNA/RNA helicase
LTTTFADLGIPEGLTTLLDELGFTTPFEIQTATIPDAIAGRDISARAPTGSGKTLAFGLPLLMRVEDAKPRHPRGLVLAPTRELADQIRRELDPIARAGGRSIAAIYGGVGYEPQKRALRKGVDVLVACPGRLADLIGQRDVDLDEVEVVVIDEADRMSDMGFLPEVKRLLDRMPKDRQTLLYSATLEGDVGVLTHQYQHNPARHEVGDMEPNIEDMRHLFWRLESTRRVQVASELIQAAGRTIVFCRTRRGADRVAKQLEGTGATAAAIHGSRTQNQRNRALKSFSDGNVEALVATDVAARGIHIDGVACVLHFDPPIDDKTYVHRSGRTARAGAQGVVVSFIDSGQLREAKKLVQRLRLRADLNTPAPESMKGAMERLEADAGTSFADEKLAHVEPSGGSRRRGFRPNGNGNGRNGNGSNGNGSNGNGRSGQRRRGDNSRPSGAVAGAGGPRRSRKTAAAAGGGGRRRR